MLSFFRTMAKSKIVWIVLFVPDATPASSNGTEPMTAFATVGKHIESPTPATVSATPSSR